MAIPEIDVAHAGRQTAHSTPIQFKWILIGSGFGLVLLTVLIKFALPQQPRSDLVILMGGLTFVFIGMASAYMSEGNTTREATITGMLLTPLAWLLLVLHFERPVPWAWIAFGFATAPLLSALGGAVGELLQGTYAKPKSGGLQWPWIGAGVVIGVLANCYGVVLGRVLFGVGVLTVPLIYMVGFGVMGFVIGYLSPGYTIADLALASLGVILIEAVFCAARYHAMFPMVILAIALAIGVAAALTGGWLGQKAQSRRKTRYLRSHC